MRGGWSTIGIAGGTLVGACVNLGPYQCTDDAQCRIGGTQGWCEDAGFCSYPDPDCPSGRRYSDLAHALAGHCTGTLQAEGSSGPDGTTTTAEVSTGPDPDSTSDDGTSEDTTLPEPVCGNGVVEGEEECDELDTVSGDGCNPDCVRSGSVRWSEVVASDGGGNDRLFGLTQLVSGDVVAVGYIQAASRDILLTRFTVDGQEVQRVVHDMDGGTDEAEAVVQGGTGRLYVCGRATVGGSSRPWVGRWDAPLTDPPAYSEALPAALTGQCYDIAYVTSGQIVAVGGSGNTAWAHTFGDGNVAGGTAATALGPSASRLKSAVRGPDGLAYVAGQVGDPGVVYQPVSSSDLGLPLVETAEVVELQTMVVTTDTIHVGGLLREVETLDDLWVAAYELDGSERWRFAPPMPAIDEVEDLAVDGEGNVYLIGHVVAEFPDRFVAKLDPAGELVWQRNDYEGSEGDDRGRSIEVLPGGDLIVVAEITGPGGDLDGWIARLAP